MFLNKRYVSLLLMVALIIILTRTLGIAFYRHSLATPPNAIWAIFSGYYRYDPRVQTPPEGLFLDRPEDSLTYFFNSTLKLCNGIYPPLSQVKVDRFEVEEVEFLGHSNYHALSLLHTRVFFTDGTSVRAVFQFEAGQNEAFPLYIIDTASIRAGSWISIGSFVRDPDIPPPGWNQYQENERPYRCNPGRPYSIKH
jgi:hypothetical protein